MISLLRPQGLSARNVLTANIVEMDQNGRALWVIVNAGEGQLVVEITADAGHELGLRPGMRVFIVVKSHSITVSTLTERDRNEEETRL